MPAAAAPTRTRDAERSREDLLREAEHLFDAHGYDAVSLGAIAAAAGLSRGAPSYFFGSKEELYVAVLERVFAAREVAMREASAPVLAWAERDGDEAALRRALAAMVRRYLRFLLERPAFVRLVARESLDGAVRLRATPRESRAMVELLEAVRRSLRRRRRRAFDLDDALIVLIGLTFAPIAHRDTYMLTIGRDLHEPAALRRHERLVVDQLLRVMLG